MQHVDVAVIGAGPYGLSLAAFFSGRGINYRIYGEPMESWRKGMPPGMSLKSDGWSSSLYNPGTPFTLAEFCRSKRIPYHDSQTPVSLETFVSYGIAFQQRFAPQVERRRLIALSRREDRFDLVFDVGPSITANRVVLAVGTHSFGFIPQALKVLPEDRLSHSSQHGPIEQLKDKHVTVIGSGASATDLAALLHEQGSDVLLVSRTRTLGFGSRSRLHRSFLQKIRSPGTGIGSGWVLKICAEKPGLFHTLPKAIRRHLVETELGPSGGWFMAQRVYGHVPLSLGRSVESASMTNGKVHLKLRTSDGTTEIVPTDHVIAATGYQTEVRRLAFLDADLQRAMRLIENAPALSRNYETSIPGLFVVGFASGYSFGPVARFVYGAMHPARHLAKHFAP
jgi:thioredoxin reductase